MADRRIQEELEKRLSENDRIQTQDIILDIEGETITLQGTVPYLSDKMAIIREVLDTEGISEVDDQLVVLESTGEGRPLTIRINETLEKQPDIETSNIDFMEQNGTVTLRGTVRTDGEKQRVEDTVAIVEGVIEIDNQLTIAPEQKESDDTIAQQVIDMLEDRDDVQTEEITVEIEDGIVTLSGQVPTWSGKNSALEAARYVSGVSEVIDNLTVGERM